MPWVINQKAHVTPRNLQKHLINNWTVTTNFNSAADGEQKTNPLMWAILETMCGENAPLELGLLRAELQEPIGPGWDMWGPTTGTDKISFHKAAEKLAGLFEQFAFVCATAVRPGFRDSLHTKGKYTNGREVLDYAQLMMMECDNPAVKKWVHETRTFTASMVGTEARTMARGVSFERWLERYLHLVKEMIDSNCGQNRFNTGTGTFANPLIIDGPMGMRYDMNFPTGISPRLVQMCDYLAMNHSKFKRSVAMKAINGGRKPDKHADPYLWRGRYTSGSGRAEDIDGYGKNVWLYEVFRVVQCDQNDLLVVPCLYDMGIGNIDTLHGGPAKGTWNKGPMKEPGGVLRYPADIQSTPIFQKAHRMRHHLSNAIPGSAGYHLLRISRSQVQKQYTGRGVVDKNNEPKFGDYIMLLRASSANGELGTKGRNFLDTAPDLKTVPGIDGISDLVWDGPPTGYREDDSCELLHITMSQAALGNKARANPDNPSPYDHFDPKKYDGSPMGAGAKRMNPTRDQWVFNSEEGMNPWMGSKANKKIRPFEKQSNEELMSWLMGMTTADSENHNIGDTARRTSGGVKVVYVPTWKDHRGRKTLDLTRGMGNYYSDIIRCGECNGRTLVMLPSGNELEACDCPHCEGAGGLNTSHLVEGNPMPVITGLRAHR